MTPETTIFINIIKQVLELGWPAIVLIFIAILWRRVIAIETELHDCLRQTPDTDSDKQPGR